VPNTGDNADLRKKGRGGIVGVFWKRLAGEPRHEETNSRPASKGPFKEREDSRKWKLIRGEPQVHLLERIQSQGSLDIKGDPLGCKGRRKKGKKSQKGPATRKIEMPNFKQGNSLWKEGPREDTSSFKGTENRRSLEAWRRRGAEADRAGLSTNPKRNDHKKGDVAYRRPWRGKRGEGGHEPRRQLILSVATKRPAGEGEGCNANQTEGNHPEENAVESRKGGGSLYGGRILYWGEDGPCNLRHAGGNHLPRKKTGGPGKERGPMSGSFVSVTLLWGNSVRSAKTGTNHNRKIARHTAYLTRVMGGNPYFQGEKKPDARKSLGHLKWYGCARGSSFLGNRCGGRASRKRHSSAWKSAVVRSKKAGE